MEYCVAKNEEDELYRGSYSSIEEALAKGPKELGFDGTEKGIWVAEAHLFSPHIDADQVLEQLICDCHDQCGEASDLWEPQLTPKTAREELEAQLNAAFQAWMEKHSEKPTCFSVNNPVWHELVK